MKKILLTISLFFGWVCSTYGQSFTTIAEDTASNYVNWDGNPSFNEGVGFEDWAFNANGNGGFAGRYLGATAIGDPSFGLFSGNNTNAFSTAERRFSSPLQPGDRFSVTIGHTATIFGEVGLVLLSGANTVLTLKFVGGGSTWVLNDGGSDFGISQNYAANTPLSFEFTYEGNNQYSYSFGTASGSNFTFSGLVSNIDGVRFFNRDQGAGQNFGINNLNIARPTYTSIADGDFTNTATWDGGVVPNGNGIININHEVNLNTSWTLNGELNIASTKTLSVNPDVVFTNNGTITVDGNFVFRSTSATATAQYGNSTGTIAGDVTVERFIPARRAFRFLSPAVTTSGSIRANWQEGATAWNDNPNPGYGTHITGLAPAIDINANVADDGTNGFDWQPSGDASMFEFNNVTQNWLPIANTNVNGLMAGHPKRLLVRGDRSLDFSAVGANSLAPTPTTLRATGSLATGNLTTGVELPTLSQEASTISPVEDTKFSFIGNPYQAVVDASLLSYNGGVRSDYLVFWDPNLGDKGAFAQVELSTGNVTLPTPAPSPSSTQASRFIMPGQGFFVGNGTSVTTPSISFSEAAKAPLTSQTEVFSTTSLAYLNMRLYTQDAWNNNQAEQDALGVRWSSEYTTEASSEDIVKFSNPNENIAVNNSSILVGIDKRNLPENQEIMELFFNNYEHSSYVLFSHYENLPENTHLYLEDRYLETSTLVSNGAGYAFSVDPSIAESMTHDRFAIRFEVGTLSNEEFEENLFSLFPNPVENHLQIQLGTLLSENAKIQLFNSLGKPIAEYGMEPNQLLHNIPVEQLNAGLYFIQVETSKGATTKKFIKQ